MCHGNIITKRVEAAALGDYVTVIYNPSSKKRIHQLRDARDIFLKYRRPESPVAIVKGAYRESQAIVMTTLEKMLEHQGMLGMITTVISREFIYFQLQWYDDKSTGI